MYMNLRVACIMADIMCSGNPLCWEIWESKENMRNAEIFFTENQVKLIECIL